MDAYILVHTKPGATAWACPSIAGIEGVEVVEKVSGPYDLVVRVGGESLTEIARDVVGQIQRVPGVLRTLTCPVLHLHGLMSVPSAA
jgi:DNA-binding Lrp family transcriptional regulator